MSLNIITFPTTNIVSSKISSTDGTHTATLEPTNLTVDNVTITSINGSPYITPFNYIDVDGNASGNIHMSNHSLDFVDGNYTASFSAGDLSVDNVNLTKINDVSFVPAVNYIDSSGLASGVIKMGTSNINFDNGTGDYTDINISGITSIGLSTHPAQFYAVSQSGAENEEPGVVINAGVFADTNSIQGGFYTDYNFANGSYNDVHMGFENSSTPTIQATSTPFGLYSSY
jgi:hypothetical protein